MQHWASVQLTISWMHQMSQKCHSFSSTVECQWLFLTCPTMFAPAPSVPGLHGIPARRVPMVEQAVQTVPLAAAAQTKGKTSTQPQSRQPARPTQRSGQAQKENVPSSKQSQWLIVTQEKSLICFLHCFYF